MWGPMWVKRHGFSFFASVVGAERVGEVAGIGGVGVDVTVGVTAEIVGAAVVVGDVVAAGAAATVGAATVGAAAIGAGACAGGPRWF